MSKKLYIPVAARRAAEQALKNITAEQEMKYKIVRNPGYRYELVANK